MRNESCQKSDSRDEAGTWDIYGRGRDGGSAGHRGMSYYNAKLERTQ